MTGGALPRSSMDRWPAEMGDFRRGALIAAGGCVGILIVLAAIPLGVVLLGFLQGLIFGH